jgi:hypothetical protein
LAIAERKQKMIKQQSSIKNVVQELINLANIKNEIRKYFYYDSKLCKAIIEYLAKDPNPHCFFKLNRFIRNTSAHYGVHFNNASIYVPIKDDKIKIPMIQFRFDIDLIDKDDNESQEQAYMCVPASLETNFSPILFKNWCTKEKQKIANNPRARIIKKIASDYDVPLQYVNGFLSHI